MDPENKFLILTAFPKTWNAKENSDYYHDFNREVQGGSKYDKLERDDTAMDFFKINLRMKDTNKFNLNDAFIEVYTTLPSTSQYDARRKELDRIIRDEIDIINNFNILSIFAISGT